MYSINITSVSFSLILLSIFIAYTKFSSILSLQPKNINHNIEGMRGFACILVFINHSAFILTNNFIENNSIDYSQFNWFGNLGSFGVELFFCITGYLFAGKIKTGSIGGDFFVKRIKRLAPAYIITSIIVFILFMIFYGRELSSIKDFASVILQVFGLGFWGSGIEIFGKKVASLNVITWTLPYEWKFYAIVPFLAAILKNQGWVVCVGVFGALALTIDIINGGILWIYFVVGFSASYIRIKEHKKITIITLFFVMMVAFATAIISNGFQYGPSRIVFVSIFFIAGIYSNTSILSIKPLSLIGTISYSIYLLHLPNLFLIVNTLNIIYPLNKISIITLLTINIIAVVTTCITSQIMYKYIESRFK